MIAVIAALATCTASVTINNTTQTATLKIQDPAANPILMEVDMNGVSFAAWYHKDTGTFDLAITATSVTGAYAEGMMPGPNGLSLDDDESPSYDGVLTCK